MTIHTLGNFCCGSFGYRTLRNHIDSKKESMCTLACHMKIYNRMVKAACAAKIKLY